MTVARSLAGLMGLVALLGGCREAPIVQPRISSMSWVLAPPVPAASVATATRPSATPASPGSPTTSPGDHVGEPSAPPEPTATLPPTSGASGGGGSAAGSHIGGTVLDEFDRPVAGATVRLADGRSATTGTDGAFRLTGAFSAGTVTVSAPGFATSFVQGLDGLPTLHLRRSDGRTAGFELSPRTLAGQVPWPVGHTAQGTAYYIDNHGNAATPVRVLEDGAFTMSVTPYGPGGPTAAVLVIGEDTDGVRCYGLTPGFDLGEAETLPAMSGAIADLPLTWDVTPTEELPDIEGRLEVLLAGLPPVRLNALTAAAGSLAAPAPGSLPGTLCFEVAARDLAGEAESRVRAYVSAETLAFGTPDLLSLPSLFVDAAQRKLSWGHVAGATGYHLSVRLRARTQPSWEAWAEGAGTFTVPADVWPESGTGEVSVEAIDATGVRARQVASVGALRQLRVAPWDGADLLRIATRKAPL